MKKNLGMVLRTSAIVGVSAMMLGLIPCILLISKGVEKTPHWLNLYMATALGLLFITGVITVFVYCIKPINKFIKTGEL